MAEMANALTGLLSGGLGIAGMIQNQHQQNWQNAFTVNNLNNSRAQQDRGLQAWNASSDPARDSSLALSDNLAALLLGPGGSASQLSELLQQYPQILDQLLGSGSDPFARGTNGQMSSLMGQNDAARDQFQGGADTAMGNFQNGGTNTGREDTQARLMDLINGQGKEMGTLGDVGSSLLGGRGQSAFTQGLQGQAGASVANGGMNDQLQQAWASLGSILNPEGGTQTLDSLQNGGLGMFGNQGMNGQNSALYNRGLQGLSGGALGTAGLTQAGGQAELQGLKDLQNGGKTDISQGLGNRGLDLANREALLPMEQAYQIAREDAARNTEGAFKRAQRQALARKGGSAGVVAAGGAEGDPMSEWADQASRSVSDAGRQALLGQQGLQLTQQGQGGSMAANAGGLENARYGAAGDLVKGMEGNATQRYQADAGIAGGALNNALGYAGLGANTALSAQDQESRRFLEALGILPQISNSATNRMGTLGNLGLGSGQLENSNMQTGLGALNSFNQSRLAGANAMDQNQTNQGQYALNSGNLANLFGNSYQTAGNNLFGQNLQAGSFGAGLNQNQMNGYNSLFQNTQAYNRDNMTGLQSALQNLLTLGGQGLTYAQAGLTGQPSVMPTQGGQNPWSSLGQAIGNVNLSGLFGKNGAAGSAANAGGAYNEAWHGG